MESIKDKWVRGGGGMEFGGKGGINEVNKKGVGEEGDCFIIHV